MYESFIARGHHFNWCLVSEGERSAVIQKYSELAVAKTRYRPSLRIMERHYYDIVYKVSSLTGMWPYMNPTARIFRSGITTIIALSLMVPGVAHQFLCKTDVQCILKTAISYLLMFVGLLKMYTIQLNTRTIKGFTRHLFADWKELKSSKEYEIMKLYAENSRRFCLVYVVYCLTTPIIFMSLSLVPSVLDIIWPLNESRPIVPPYPCYYFVDTQEYFFKIYCHSVIGWEAILAGIVAHDCMFVTYVEHVCSMFAIVGFADLLENTFTLSFAVQMLIVTFSMSVTLLQITRQDSDILESIRYALYVIGQLIHLSFLSFEGQKLIDHSVQACDKIYNSSWYEVPMRSQKLTVLVMMKSVRPSFLSAGKVYIFSLESFTTVLQTSMSYFTVFSSFQ